MNKYLKILTLSGGLIGAIAPTAINLDSNTPSGLKAMYESVEKLQNTLPRLSKINYKLDINAENNTDNVSFISTDTEGNETKLSKQETINYLNETLEQTSIEYEQLKDTLTKAIQDTMEYLESYKNGNITLTNEQKIYIKEHSNSIKYLAETLEDLSEDIICAIDGCEDEVEDFDTTTRSYMQAINNIEARIQALHEAISSLQFINSSPFFFRQHINPNHIVYGFHYNSELDNDNSEQSNLDSVEEDKENLDNKDDIDTILEVENKDNDDTLISENSVNEDLEGNNTENNEVDDNVSEVTDDTNNKENSNLVTDNNEDKPTTFGLKSNIDTYAPTKRNIDTFFNTALQNNQYGYGGYGYGMPYGYGGYGYGMPYGGGYYNTPYQNLNSNLINRKVLEVQNEPYSSSEVEKNEVNDNNNNDIENNKINTKKIKTKKFKKFDIKRLQNVDSYTGTTIKSNVNTMGESKISRFFKEKYSILRDRVKNRKNKQQTPPPVQDLPTEQIVEDNIITDETLEDKNYNIPTTEQEITTQSAIDNKSTQYSSMVKDIKNKIQDAFADEEIKSNTEQSSNLSRNNTYFKNQLKDNSLTQEKDIKAR